MHRPPDRLCEALTSDENARYANTQNTPASKRWPDLIASNFFRCKEFCHTVLHRLAVRCKQNADRHSL